MSTATKMSADRRLILAARALASSAGPILAREQPALAFPDQQDAIALLGDLADRLECAHLEGRIEMREEIGAAPEKFGLGDRFNTAALEARDTRVREELLAKIRAAPHRFGVVREYAASAREAGRHDGHQAGREEMLAETRADPAKFGLNFRDYASRAHAAGRAEGIKAGREEALAEMLSGQVKDSEEPRRDTVVDGDDLAARWNPRALDARDTRVREELLAKIAAAHKAGRAELRDEIEAVLGRSLEDSGIVLGHPHIRTPAPPWHRERTRGTGGDLRDVVEHLADSPANHPAARPQEPLNTAPVRPVAEESALLETFAIEFSITPATATSMVTELSLSDDSRNAGGCHPVRLRVTVDGNEIRSYRSGSNELGEVTWHPLASTPSVYFKGLCLDSDTVEAIALRILARRWRGEALKLAPRLILSLGEF